VGDSTLRDVFAAGLEGYLRTRWLPFHLLKAAYAIAQCRTAALGGHVKRCQHGHVQQVWYNSCRHRACPLCAWTKIDQWLNRIRDRLLPTDHYHLTCTLPAELRVFWQLNPKRIGDLLFKTVRETLFELLEMPKYLGAKPGLLMSLHSWSRSLATHVHVHCLITGGGVTPEGRWKPCTNGFLVPTQRVASRLRRRFTQTLERLLDQGRLKLPPDLSRFEARRLIQRSRRKKWVVDRRERYAHGRGVAHYLARYVRGGPVKNQRLMSFDGQTVTLRLSRKGEKLRKIDLPVGEFIRRILVHVPPIGYRVVRSCGLYHHHYAEQLAACREQLGGDGKREGKDLSAEETEEVADEGPGALEDFCRICGCLLEVEVLPRAPPPPELAKYLGPRR